MPELVVDQRIGVLVPKGTSADIVARLNTGINAALADEKVRKAFTEQAQDPAGGTAEQYGKLVRDDSDKIARLVKILNIEVQ